MTCTFLSKTQMDRRDFNARILGTSILASVGSAGALLAEDRLTSMESKARRWTSQDNSMPVAFVAHGSPELAIDPVRGAPFVKWGQTLPRPTVILVISAHWEKSRPVQLSSTKPRELVYDFSGFPRELYRVRYDAPGALGLAQRVESILPKSSVVRTERGLDHGAWTPLVHLFPNANIPVLQVSMPSSEGTRGLFDFGRALAPLRDEGVLILGSGNITHAIGEKVFPREPPAWAKDFDAWTADAIQLANYDDLMDFAIKAPSVRRNHPTPDHFLPLLVVAGAASVKQGKPRFVIEAEFEYGVASRRSVEFV